MRQRAIRVQGRVGQSRRSSTVPPMSGLPNTADFCDCPSLLAFGPIVLQKSKVAGLKILRENTKQRAIADSYDLNRVTEVACEFCVRP